MMGSLRMWWLRREAKQRLRDDHIMHKCTDQIQTRPDQYVDTVILSFRLCRARSVNSLMDTLENINQRVMH